MTSTMIVVEAEHAIELQTKTARLFAMVRAPVARFPKKSQSRDP